MIPTFVFAGLLFFLAIGVVISGTMSSNSVVIAIGGVIFFLGVVVLIFSSIANEWMVYKHSKCRPPANSVDTDSGPTAIKPAQAKNPGEIEPFAAFVILVASLVSFILLGLLVESAEVIAILVGVIFLHESGHYLGMRWFGYSNVTIFFIPLFGAAVTGKKKDVEPWQEAIVLLLGPVPGILLGCTVYIIDLVTPLPRLYSTATMFVTVNFLNLLPIVPLDGGKLFELLVAHRSRWLEAVTTLLGFVCMMTIILGPRWVGHGLLSGVIAAIATYRTAGAASVFRSRWSRLPDDISGLSDEQLRDLFAVCRKRYSGDLSEHMKQVFERASVRTTTGTATGRLLAVHFGAIVLALTTALTTRMQEGASHWVKDLFDVSQKKTTIDGKPDDKKAELIN
jgi:Zn-dependent protease